MKTKKNASDRINDRITLLKEKPDEPYFIRYRIEAGRFGKLDAGEKDGLTQDLIFVSCMTHSDGSYSQLWHAMNGATGEPLHHDDVFKAWILMASSLREKEDLSPEKREFLETVFEAWRSIILGAA
jgi:hypothetical protein